MSIAPIRIIVTEPLSAPLAPIQGDLTAIDSRLDAVESELPNKADASAVNSSLNALQTNVNEVEGESIARDNALDARLDTVEATLPTKADAAAVNTGLDTLQTNINAVEGESIARDNDLAADIATKADQTALDAISAEVDTKANAGDVNTGLNTLQTEINAVEGESIARDNTEIARATAAEKEGSVRLSMWDKLWIKAGVYPLVTEGDNIVMSMDRRGRVIAPDFIRPGDNPPAMKGGIIRYIVDAFNSPMLWFDARRQAMRGAGDMHDRPERVGASPFQIINSNRDALAFIGATGEVYEPAAWNAPVVYTKSIDDGGGAVQQVFIADGTNERRLTASIVDCHSPEMIAPGLVRYGRSDGLVGLVRAPIGVSAVGGSAIEGYFSYGQSLALGSASYTPGTLPTLRYPPSARVLMFNGGVRAGIDGGGYNATSYASLVPSAEDLDGSTQLSDTGLTGLGFTLVRETEKDALVCSAGVGGTPYLNLKKGTTPYNNFIYGIQRAKDLADAAGRAFTLEVVNWRQGESDEDKAAPVYLGYLQELRADFTTDIPPITGQDPLIVLQQISRFGGASGADELVGPASAQRHAGLNLSGFILAGPQYVCDFGDQYHMLPASYCLMASYAAKAIRRHKKQSRPWKPLNVISAVRSGKRIDITVAGGVIDYGGAVTIDTTRVSDPGKYGVVFRDSNTGTGSGEVSVMSVEVTGRNTLSVYLSGVPSGTTPEIGFGNWKAGSETGQGRLTGLRCCIRDNDSEGCPVTGIPLHNYMIGHKVGVTTA